MTAERAGCRAAAGALRTAQCCRRTGGIFISD